MRYRLICELYKNLLGPKHGPSEVLRENPWEEYITGILSPADIEIARDPELEADLPSVLPEDELPELSLIHI